MSGIRVTYSGLISFVIRLVSVFTGIIFTLIVTRQLTQEEFGTWSLIGGLLLYVVTADFIISYWLTREVARGIDSAKTAVVSGSVMSIGAIFAYLVIAYFVGLQSDADQNVLFFAVILVPMGFLNDILNYMNYGWKPQLVSYGFLAFELTKIPVALILVYFLKMGIEGAILSTFVAYLSSIIIHLIYGRQKLKHKFQKKFLKKWFKLSWIPLYQSIPNLAFVSDVVIFSVITGSVIGIAYVTAARTIANLVQHTSTLSDAIYPKLLAGGKAEYLQENLMRLLYFAIPLLALSITLARPGLFALNPIYENAVPVVILMSIRTMLSIINKLFHSALQGIEEVDINEDSTFMDYIKSKLFLLPTIRVIQYGSYVVVLVVVFMLLTSASQLELAIFWSIVALIIEIPFVFYLYVLIRKNFSLKLDVGSLCKYVVVSIGASGLIYILMEKFLTYKNNIFEFLPNLLVYVGIGVGLYLTITYLTDRRTKELFDAIISEVRHKNI